MASWMPEAACGQSIAGTVVNVESVPPWRDDVLLEQGPERSKTGRYLGCFLEPVRGPSRVRRRDIRVLKPRGRSFVAALFRNDLPPPCLGSSVFNVQASSLDRKDRETLMLMTVEDCERPCVRWAGAMGLFWRQGHS
jgi:hypothetical protein